MEDNMEVKEFLENFSDNFSESLTSFIGEEMDKIALEKFGGEMPVDTFIALSGLIAEATGEVLYHHLVTYSLYLDNTELADTIIETITEAFEEVMKNKEPLREEFLKFLDSNSELKAIH